MKLTRILYIILTLLISMTIYQQCELNQIRTELQSIESEILS